MLDEQGSPPDRIRVLARKQQGRTTSDLTATAQHFYEPLKTEATKRATVCIRQTSTANPTAPHCLGAFMYNSESHYAALANSYDEHWLYSEQYVQTMATAITECLELVDTDQLADIGCGTGIYARAIDQMIGFRQPIQCVDPSGPMLKQLQASNRFHTIEKDAIAFLESSHTANKYLIKEAVHHIDDKERLFKAIRSSLGPKDVFLILLLPPTIEYPLFRAALDRYEERQPHYNDLIAMAESHGLSTQSAIISIPLRIEKAKYLQMVKGRYMSLLSTFTDAETAAGIQEIDRTYPETVLDFPDRFVFLCMTLGSHEQ